MTAEEIRAKLDINEDSWSGIQMYSGSNGAIALVLVEIAAQLAELNETLKKKMDPYAGMAAE